MVHLGRRRCDRRQSFRDNGVRLLATTRLTPSTAPIDSGKENSGRSSSEFEGYSYSSTDRLQCTCRSDLAAWGRLSSSTLLPLTKADMLGVVMCNESRTLLTKSKYRANHSRFVFSAARCLFLSVFIPRFLLLCPVFSCWWGSSTSSTEVACSHPLLKARPDSSGSLAFFSTAFASECYKSAKAFLGGQGLGFFGQQYQRIGENERRADATHTRREIEREKKRNRRFEFPSRHRKKINKSCLYKQQRQS